MRSVSITLLLMSTLLPVGALADTSRVLRGAPGVRVVLFHHTNDKANALSSERIKTDVELRLRLAGIRILSKNEWMATPGMPSLHVYFSLVRREEIPHLYAYMIHVFFLELVRQERRTYEEPILAATWGVPKSAGLVGAASLRDVRKQILDEVDEFINAYLKANPRQP